MNSAYLKTLSDSLESVIKSVIKDKIGQFHIKSSDNIGSMHIITHFESKKIEILSSELIEFDDNTSIPLEHIKNISDLLSILEYIEKWFKFREAESILIQWSISDFEGCASEIEEETHGEKLPIFDRSKFAHALKILEQHHDCNFGITWNDIKHHLNEYCRI